MLGPTSHKISFFSRRGNFSFLSDVQFATRPWSMCVLGWGVDRDEGSDITVPVVRRREPHITRQDLSCEGTERVNSRS